MTLPIGRGWLRIPSQPSPTTSSAPARAPASGWPSRWPTSCARRRAGGHLRGLEPHGEGRDPALGGPGGHPGVLGRGLGPTTPSRGGRIGEGHESYRTVGAGGVVGGGTGPTGIGVQLLDDVPVLGEHLLPPLRRGGRRRSAGDGATTTASIGPAAPTSACSASAAAPKPCAGSTGWHRTERASRAAATEAASRGRSDTTAQDRTGRGGSRVGRLVEDRPEPGVAPAGAGLVGLRLGERIGDDDVEHAVEGDRFLGADHLDEPRLVDDRHLGPTCEQHLTGAPPEPVVDQVGPDRPEVLGTRHREEGDPTATGPARLPGPLQGRGHHPGGGDRRHGVHGDTRWHLATELPRERGHGPLGTAVRTGIRLPPPRPGSDAEDAAVSGGGHQRQGRVEDVQVAPEVHAEHRQPVLLGAPAEVGLPGDPGHVDHGVEPAVLLHQLGEQAADGPAVGDRHRRGPGRATGGHDSTGRRLLGLRQLRRSVEGHQRIDGDDVPAVAAELLGDRPRRSRPRRR